MPLTIWDFALPALLVLFLPLGFWRGLWRELLTSIGISLAALTTIIWTSTWSRLLSGLLRVDQPSAQLMTQMAGFVAITLLVGYGSSLLPLRIRNGNLWIRLLGALVGLVNGSIILSFILQFIYFYSVATGPQQNPVTTSMVAWNLANWAGWFYLAVALLMILLVALSALVRVVAAISRLAQRPSPATIPNEATTQAPSRQGPESQETGTSRG